MKKVLSFAGVLIALVSLAASEVEVAEIKKRVTDLQPRPSEKRFDKIGWATEIREARRLAEKHQRPVFLFTHDGRMNIGRC